MRCTELPQQLVLSSLRLQVLNQVTSRVGEHLEQCLELSGRNVKVLLKSFKEIVVTRLVLLLP